MTAAPSRILICGGRKFTDAIYLFKVLDECKLYFAPDFCVCVGGANGADDLARRWALEQMAPTFVCNAQWDTFGQQAGSIRNQWMLKWFEPDLVIAFPGGVGTAHMKKIAKQKGVIVYEG